MAENEKILCRFESIAFQGEGYAIFRGTSLGKRISAKGNVLDDPKSLLGVDLELEGVWEQRSNFDPTLKFTNYEIKEDPMVFFLMRVVGYLTDVQAREVVNRFGDSLVEVMQSTPEQLLEIKGIGEKRLKRIKSAWDENLPIFRLGRELAPLGVTTREIQMIHEFYGASALEIATKEPYSLVAIRGIGFKRADEIARKVGVPHDSPSRLASCAEYVMREVADREGHSAYSATELVKRMQEFLASEQRESVTMDQLEQGIIDLIESDRARFVVDRDGVSTYGRVVTGDAIALAWSYAYEKGILRMLSEAPQHAPIVEDIDAWINDYEKRNGCPPFGADQREAIRLANEGHPVISISGFAGTGKTTTSRAILELMTTEIDRDDIHCCALAGIAAKRIEMQTGFPSDTIHGTLGYQGEDWGFNSSNTLPYRLVTLDESGMVDNELMYRFLSAIDFSTTRVILLGDPAQVKPVGSGQPYSDMLRHKLVPNVTLTEIFRTSKGSVINTMAESVRNGRVPEVDGDFEDARFVDHSISDYHGLKKTMGEAEFRQLREMNNLTIRESIIAIAEEVRLDMQHLRANDPWGYATRFQVVSPQRKGTLGVDELNEVLQQAFNPGGEFVSRPDGRQYRVGDRVVHMKNKKMKVITQHQVAKFKNGADLETDEARVVNGQLGIVFAVNEDNEMVVYYPFEKRFVLYGRNELGQNLIDLSYALTVHKTQGSEYQQVVMPVSMSQYSMLTPSLLYTGMTRAKAHLTLVGQREALAAACNPRRLEEGNRNTIISVEAATKKATAKPRPAI